MEKSEILRKAEKLLARTDPASGGTLAECTAAAEILSRMLAKHQLSLADLVTGVSNEKMERRNGRKTEMPFVGGEAIFRDQVARAYDCKTVTSGQKQWILGHTSDVEIAEYTANTLLASIGKMAFTAAIAFGVQPRTKRGGTAQFDDFVASFLIGAAEAIRDRITTMRKHETTDERALVVVKDKELREFIHAEFPSLSSGRTVSVKNATARELGASAGASVAITAGVGARPSAGGQRQLGYSPK